MKQIEKSFNETEFKQLTDDIESILYRKNIKNLKEAAFKSGKMKTILPKFASILSRRIKSKVSFGTFPKAYENSYGKFYGYPGYVGDIPIRLNVLLTKSDIIYSLDVYEDTSSIIPTNTIDFNGYNIVQTVDMVSDFFTGEFKKYDESVDFFQRKKLTERITLQDMCADWLNDNVQYLKDISDEKFDYESKSLQQEFLDYIQNKHRQRKSSISSGSFKWNIKKAIEGNKYLQSHVNPKHVPSINIKQGVPDKAALILDSDARAAYEKAIKESGADKFEEVEEKVRLLANMDPFFIGMLIYGRPGTGKTFNVERILKEEGADYIAVKGGIKGSSELLLMLYLYKEDKVLLFDDNDSVFGSDKSKNILKIALDNKPIRELGFGTPIKIKKEIAKNVGLEEDAVIPANFEFTSRIIFLTNKTKIDPAIQSRLAGSLYELNFSLDEMYDLIKSKLYNIYAHFTEITNNMKEEVFDFLVKLKPAAEDIDFRRFEACLAERYASYVQGNDKWMARSARILSMPKTWEA